MDGGGVSGCDGAVVFVASGDGTLGGALGATLGWDMATIAADASLADTSSRAERDAVVGSGMAGAAAGLVAFSAS